MERATISNQGARKMQGRCKGPACRFFSGIAQNGIQIFMIIMVCADLALIKRPVKSNLTRTIILPPQRGYKDYVCPNSVQIAFGNDKEHILMICFTVIKQLINLSTNQRPYRSRVSSNNLIDLAGRSRYSCIH